jgi:uncharacterized protein (TIGR02246 family)
MKKIIFSILVFLATSVLYGQSVKPTAAQEQEIRAVIDKYSEAREKNDTVLLKNILGHDVDQLVSTGEWRDGIAASVKGMLRSSSGSPGTRVLTVDKIRMLTSQVALVDCRYEIKSPNGDVRKMWSTFVLVLNEKTWKIGAIRNMLPSAP